MDHRQRSDFAIVFKSEAKDILKQGGPVAPIRLQVEISMSCPAD
jgi:hypothetical protein